MTNICGIYAIVHRDSGQRYIGASRRVQGRWAEHKRELRGDRHSTPRLQSAWDSYGADAFDFIVIEECAADDLKAREQAHLDQWRDLLLNTYATVHMTAGTKRTFSAEWRAKLSTAAKNRMMNPETRLKLIAANTGRVVSEETREKNRAGNTGKKRSPETIERMRLAQLARYKPR